MSALSKRVALCVSLVIVAIVVTSPPAPLSETTVRTRVASGVLNTVAANCSTAGPFFHVDDFAGLGGGSFGRLTSLQGAQSLWCGARDPLCNYATLPGYGNRWEQHVTTLYCLSVDGPVTLDYLISYDLEAGYDFVSVEYDTCDNNWTTMTSYTGIGAGSESLQLSAGQHSGYIRLRFRVSTDALGSDEDGLWDSDGAVIVDSISVSDNSGPVLAVEDFEGESVGSTTTSDWTAGFDMPPAATITPASAVQFVIDSLITPSPYADSLVGFFYGQGSNPLVPPGCVFSDFCETFEYVTPDSTYFFWLDYEPFNDWSHPCAYVFMSAATGAYTVFGAESWPVINGVEFEGFGLGNSSPALIHGSYADSVSAPPDYTPVPRTNTQDWAIVAVGKNWQKTSERNSRLHDINNIKDYLNGSDLGPKMHIDNIMIAPGEGANGVTVQELCVEIDNVLNLGTCNKLYFYYIGHGAKSGRAMWLKDDEGGSVRYPYEDLACKLLGDHLNIPGPKEYCIAIGACYSGSAIEPLCEKKDGEGEMIKGSIITSASGSNTSIRDPDGKPFYKSLRSCGRDTLADFDDNGTVDLFEALTWAREKDSDLKHDSPQARACGDKRNVKFLSPVEGAVKDNGATGTKLEYQAVKYCYKFRRAASAGGDSTVCATNLYVKNPSDKPHNPSQKVSVVCKRRGESDFTVPPFWPKLGAGQTKCFARLDFVCRSFVISGAGVNLTTRTTVAPTTIDEDLRTTAYNPGDRIFHTDEIEIETGANYNTSLATSSPWTFTINPLVFSDNGYVTDQIVILRGDVGSLATQGDSLTWTINRLDVPETRTISINALVIQEEASAINTSREHNYQAVRALSGVTLTADSLQLNHAVIQLEGTTIFSIGPGAYLGMKEAAIQSDSSTNYTAVVQGNFKLDRGVFVAPETGLFLNGASGSAYGGGVFASNGDGLILTGDMSSTTMEFFEIWENSDNGLVLDAASNVSLNTLTILDSGLDDVVAENASDGRLIDCEFDDTKVDVDGTSTLIRSWTTHLLVHDNVNQPTPGVWVEVRDVSGGLVWQDTTDADGAVNYMVLDEWSQTGTTRDLQTPHEIFLHDGSDSLTIVHTATSSELLDVTFPEVGTGVATDTPTPPKVLSVYPNPFNPQVTISFRMEQADVAVLTVYNVAGAAVRRLISGPLGAGLHQRVWDGRNDGGNRVASGVYHVRLVTGNRAQTIKAVLIQ